MARASLHFHTSNRLDILADHLAGFLETEPLPPLEQEVIVVQSRGMMRWLSLELAQRLGIAANLRFHFPGELCNVLSQSLMGFDRQQDPWARETMTWALFGLLTANDPSVTGDPGTTKDDALGAYLADDGDQRKRYQLATRLSNLFDDYQMFRPDTVLAWEADPSAAGAGTGGTGVDAELRRVERWQAPLWSRLVDLLGEGHRARRFTDLEGFLRTTDTPLDDLLGRGLPSRISVFGVSTLPPLFIRVLSALARFVPVRLYFTSPTYHYWGDLRSERELGRLERRMRRGDQNTGEIISGDLHVETGHRLLAALGRQGRDFFNLLQAADEDATAWHELAFVESEGPGVLATLQRDILHLQDRSTGDPPSVPLDPSDRSLRIHVCHSPMREMEVLRDELLDALAHDPDLRPDDILVMVPDIDVYSPYIEAVFGGSPSGGSSVHLPYSIADRRAAHEWPPAASVVRLLELVGGRLTLTEVFDLLETDAIRRTFDLAEGQIPTLRQRLVDANVRWGIDGRQRQRDFDLPNEDANTWRAGLDRLLMGLATGCLDASVAGVVPLAGALAGDAEALGGLARYVDVLFGELDRLREPRPLGPWADDLLLTLDRLFTAASEEEEGALQVVHDAFDELRAAQRILGDGDAARAPVHLEVVRQHLGTRLGADGGAGHFLTGRITFCALKPMRTIPFDVLCVAGLDSDSFPRRDMPRGFDLIRRQPRLGDRSLGDDDRYLFLEILLAARKRLILTHVGRSQRDGAEKAPSVVISELLDTLERTVHVTPAVDPAVGTAMDPDTVRDHLVVEHRLHPFAPGYFETHSDDLFSYSPASLEAARALLGPRRPEMPFFDDGADATEDAVDPNDAHGEDANARDGNVRDDDIRDDNARDDTAIDLDAFLRFWVGPSKFFARRVLHLSLVDFEEEDLDSEPFELTGLEEYQIRQWMLDRRVGPRAEDDLRRDHELALLRGRGDLPLAGLGRATYSALENRVSTFVAGIPAFDAHPPLPVVVTGDGWRLEGRLDDLTDDGQLRYRCARLTGKDRLRAWILHLVWNCLEHPVGVPRETRIVAEGPLEQGQPGPPAQVRFPALANAHALLDDLVAGYRQGQLEPLPVFEHASLAYVEQQRKLADPRSRSKLSAVDVARRAWEGQKSYGFYAPADRKDPWVDLCFRGRDPIAEDAFVQWSTRLWGPLLDHLVEG